MGGATLFVSAFVRRTERFEQGRLVLQVSAREPVVWQPYRLFRAYGPAVSLRPPYEVQSVGPVTGPGAWKIKTGLFRAIALYANGEARDLAVPTIDVPLVRAVLASVERKAAGTSTDES